MGFEIGRGNDDPGERNVTVPGVDFVPGVTGKGPRCSNARP